jgi:hypothetical protein
VNAGIVAALLVAAAGLGVFLGAGKLSAGRKISAKHLGSFGLLVVLIAFFYLYCTLAPLAPSRPWLGVAILAATLAVLRLMTKFEAPR